MRALVTGAGSGIGAAIAEALDRFEAGEFDPDRLRAHAERFTEARYAESLYAAVVAAP